MTDATLLEAIRQGLEGELLRDDRVILLGEDVGLYGGAFKVTEGFLERFGPERILDTPIAEAAIIGAATGAAMAGFRPVVEIQFMDFVTNGFNQLVNFASKLYYRQQIPVPMVVRGPVGAGVGAGPFHSQSPEIWFIKSPGLKVVEPSRPADALGLLRAAVRDENPVLFLEHKLLYRHKTVREPLPGEDHIVPIGKGVVRRIGTDLTIVTYGAMTLTALDGAARLSEEGFEAEVIDLRTIYPWDRELVFDSIKKTSRLIVLHEDTVTAGIGAEIAATVAEQGFEWLDAPVARVAPPYTPVPYSHPLEGAFLPSAEDLLARSLAVCTF